MASLPHAATRLPLDLSLADVALFVRIVETGSLSAAARERNVPVSQVSRALARLEGVCRARLLHRSTHALSLTDEGDGFLLHARQLLATADDLQGVLGARAGGPSGWVRLGVSAVLAQAIVAPSLPALYARHPGLHVDLAVDDRPVDLAREGIDLAIRTGDTGSDQMVARPLGVLTRSLYAAPGYIARHGMPASPQDLASHHLLANSASPGLNLWAWHEADDADVAGPAPRQTLRVDGQTRTDNTAVMLALALHGVGIARIVDRVAQPLVQRGALVPVLPGRFGTQPVAMHAVMLQERHRLPKVRACIDHLAAWIADSGSHA
jgi:DNA-binding transcriptional LysR family regulator